MKPSVGRIVLYRIPGLGIRPAIVIELHADGTVALEVFTAIPEERFQQFVKHEWDADGNPTDLCWAWPPRVTS